MTKTRHARHCSTCHLPGHDRRAHARRNPPFFTDANGVVRPERAELGRKYDPLKTLAAPAEVRALIRQGKITDPDIIRAAFPKRTPYQGPDPHGYITPRELRGTPKRRTRTKAMKALERRFIETFPRRKNPVVDRHPRNAKYVAAGYRYRCRACGELMRNAREVAEHLNQKHGGTYRLHAPSQPKARRRR